MAAAQTPSGVAKSPTSRFPGKQPGGIPGYTPGMIRPTDFTPPNKPYRPERGLVNPFITSRPGGIRPNDRLSRIRQAALGRLGGPTQLNSLTGRNPYRNLQAIARRRLGG